MNQTFFFISPDWIDPFFYLWIVIGAGYIGYVWFRSKSQSDQPDSVKDPQKVLTDTKLSGFGEELWSILPTYIIGAIVIKFLIPFVMVADPEDPTKIQGIPIRGYGFFLLVAIVAGVLLAISRAKRLGLHPDQTINLCFALFAAGIVGARAFYVIQYWDTFDSARDIIDMTKGGLVVYGSVIGSVTAAIVYLKLNKLPALLMLDVLAPCMMVGLSIGRIGCLMNGCCWGGICDTNLPAITFPEGSPPYSRHVETGELFGMKAILNDSSDSPGRKIIEIQPGSPAAQRGIQPNAQITGFAYNPNPNDDKKPERIPYQIEQGKKVRTIEFVSDEVPWRSLPVHPSQIYSSVNAFFVFLFLWCYFPRRRHDGEIIGMMLIIYPMGRFLLEYIRSDEMSQLGTGFTISQLISFGSILIGFSVIIFGTLYGKRTENFVANDALELKPGS